MALGITHQLEGGVYHLKGVVDESVDFSPFLSSTLNPLKLDWRGVQWINSLGVRKLANFARALGDKPVEFHALPPVLIETINVLPMVIGGESKMERIRSLFLPMTCSGNHQAQAVIAVDQIRTEGAALQLPEYTCSVCSMPLQPDLDCDLDDFLFFMSSAS